MGSPHQAFVRRKPFSVTRRTGLLDPIQRVSGIGPVSFKSLLEYYDNDLEAAWRANTKELAQAGLTQKTIENVVKLRTTSTPQRELEKLEKLRIRVITWKDKNYPPLLPTRGERHMASSPWG